MLVDLLVSTLAFARKSSYIKYVASYFVSGPGSQIILILLAFFDTRHCYPQPYPGRSCTISRNGLAQSVALGNAAEALAFIVILLLVLAIIVYLLALSRPDNCKPAPLAMVR